MHYRVIQGRQVVVEHISEVMTYKKCRRLYHWSGRDRDNLEPRRAYSPFFIGRAVHHCIEQLYSEGTPPYLALSKFLREELQERRKSVLWPIDREVVRKDTKLIKGLLTQYRAWAREYQGPYRDENLDYLAHELEFGSQLEPILLKVDGKPLEPWVAIAGTFDGLVRLKSDGRLLVPEYKTCRSVKERTALLPHDEQASTYAYAAQEWFGEPVAGILYTLICKKVAVKPAVTQTGLLSRNKNIDTTPEMYLRAIYQHHGQVSDRFVEENYGGILEDLRIRDPLIARLVIERSPQQIDLWVRELHATILEMVDDSKFPYATRTWTCPRCFFSDPCKKVDAGDTDGAALVLELEYQKRKAFDPVDADV